MDGWFPLKRVAQPRYQPSTVFVVLINPAAACSERFQRFTGKRGSREFLSMVSPWM